MLEPLPPIGARGFVVFAAAPSAVSFVKGEVVKEQGERIEEYRRLLRPIVAAHRWLLFAEPAAAQTDLVRVLRELGASPPLVLASMIGTGPVAAADDAEIVIFDRARDPRDISDAFHVFQSAVVAPPPAARAAIDRWDPEHVAVAATPITLGEVPSVAGRRRYGARQAAWVALEDKVVVDAFWDRCGVDRAPSRIVPMDAAALARSAQELDRGAGTVWAGDSTAFVHGGGTGTRWVRNGSEAAAVTASFADRYEQVRVMPFLEGIPCSIHGIVLAEGLVVLRPVEMLIFRRADSPEFFYAGFDTYWEPREEDWHAMQRAARKVGESLRTELDYRGPFTIDGILTGEGFMPTELNPRFGGALGLYRQLLPELPLPLLCWAIIEGELTVNAASLEALLLDAAAERAVAGCHGISSVTGDIADKTTVYGLRRTSSTHEAREGAQEERGFGAYQVAHGWRAERLPAVPIDAQLTVGPGSLGTFVRFTPETGHLPRGPSMAPAAIAAFRCADREFGLQMGDLTAAVDVRPKGGS